MRLLFLVGCLLVAAAGGAAAQTPSVGEPAQSVTGITIAKVGSFAGRSTSATAEAGQQSPTGTVGTVTDWHFVSDSTDIDGKTGTQFGIEFHIEGAPAGEAVTLHLALTFLAQGIRNPNTGETLHSAKIAFPNIKIGALCLLGYGFDNAWEVVPGAWTEQIWYRDHMLAERTFTVSKGQ